VQHVLLRRALPPPPLSLSLSLCVCVSHASRDYLRFSRSAGLDADRVSLREIPRGRLPESILERRKIEGRGTGGPRAGRGTFGCSQEPAHFSRFNERPKCVIEHAGSMERAMERHGNPRLLCGANRPEFGAESEPRFDGLQILVSVSGYNCHPRRRCTLR